LIKMNEQMRVAERNILEDLRSFAILHDRFKSAFEIMLIA